MDRSGGKPGRASALHADRPRTLPCVLAGAVLGVSANGVFLAWTRPDGFEVWSREDGFVEWSTCLALLSASLFALFVCLRRARGRPAVLTWALIAAACFFGSMEEISWGQRIFGIESPGWFKVHNAQQETNIHNLVVGNVKLNRLVFGKILGLVMFLYFLGLPAGFRLAPRLRRLLSRLAFPVPRVYHTLLLLAVFGCVALVSGRHSRTGEIREFAGSIIFLLVLIDPWNAPLFRAPSREESPGRGGGEADTLPETRP